jgi:putative ABC transport system permease protein
MSRLLITKALRDFRRMGLRAWLVFLVLAAGIAIYAGGFIAQASVFHTRDHYDQALRLADVDIGFAASEREELPAWMQKTLAGQHGEHAFGATDAELRFIAPSAIELAGAKPVMSLDVFIDPSRPLSVNQIELLEGRYLKADENAAVMVEASAARIHGFKVGGTLTLDPYLNPHEVTIVGIVRSAEFLLPTANPEVLLPSKGSLIVLYRPLSKLGELFGSPMYNSANIRFTGSGATTAQKDKVIEASQPFVITSCVGRDEAFSHRFLDEDLKAFSIFIPALSGIFALVTFLVLLLSLSRLMSEQQREIAALLAIGHTAPAIILSYVFAASVYALVAAGLGAAAAPYFGAFLAKGYAGAVGLPPVLPLFVWTPVLQGALVGIFCTLFATVAPAIAITRLSPAAAMRPNAAAGFTRRFARVDTLITRLATSTATRFGLRNLLRRPRLTFSVVSLIAFAMALSLAFKFSERAWSQFAVDSFASEKWDGVISFKVPLKPADAEAIFKTRGVNSAHPMVSGFSAICRGELCVDHRVVGIDPADNLRGFRFAEGAMFTSNDELSVVLNRNFNHTRPYILGEEVELKNGPRSVRVKVVGLTSDMTMGVGYVPTAVARRLLALETEVTGFTGVFDAPAREVKKALFAHEMVTYVSLKVEMEDLVYEYMKVVWAIIRGAMAISLALAVLFMLTGISMALLEREHEYATLRSFGYSDASIIRMIMVEVAAEAVMALLLCMPLSFLLAQYLRFEMARAWFDVEFFYRADDFATIILPALLILPFAALPSLIQLLRQAPATMLRARGIG